MSERSERLRIISALGEEAALTEDAINFLRYYVTRTKALEKYIQSLHSNEIGQFLFAMDKVGELQAQVTDKDMPQGFFWVTGAELKGCP